MWVPCVTVPPSSQGQSYKRHGLLYIALMLHSARKHLNFYGFPAVTNFPPTVRICFMQRKASSFHFPKDSFAHSSAFEHDLPLSWAPLLPLSCLETLILRPLLLAFWSPRGDSTLDIHLLLFFFLNLQIFIFIPY